MSLAAAACSTTTETNTAGSDFVVRTPPTDADQSDPLVGADELGVTKQPGTDGSKALVRTPSSAVLAAALAEADEGSYSFDMGMDMNMNMMGMEMVMAPEGPVMSGSVSGDRMHAAMDMGAVMSAMTVSDEQGNPVPVPELADFDDLQFEMWLDGTLMTVDLSGMASLDPTITGAAADGPVSFDLAELEGLGVEDVTSSMLDSVDMFGPTQSMDPAATADLLRSLDTVVEVGSDVVAGRDVTVYEGTLSFAEYAEAMGEALDEMDELAMLGDQADAMAALDAMHVEMTVMVDADGLLRRFEMFMDMGPMFEAMFSTDAPATDRPTSGDVDELDELGEAFEDAFEAMFAEMEMTMNVWMELDDYGDAAVPTAPAAVDLTGDAESVFGTSFSV